MSHDTARAVQEAAKAAGLQADVGLIAREPMPLALVFRLPKDDAPLTPDRMKALQGYLHAKIGPDCPPVIVVPHGYELEALRLTDDDVRRVAEKVIELQAKPGRIVQAKPPIKPSCTIKVPIDNTLRFIGGPCDGQPVTEVWSKPEIRRPEWGHGYYSLENGAYHWQESPLTTTADPGEDAMRLASPRIAEAIHQIHAHRGNEFSEPKASELAELATALTLLPPAFLPVINWLSDRMQADREPHPGTSWAKLLWDAWCDLRDCGSAFLWAGNAWTIHLPTTQTIIGDGHVRCGTLKIPTDEVKHLRMVAAPEPTGSTVTPPAPKYDPARDTGGVFESIEMADKMMGGIQSPTPLWPTPSAKDLRECEITEECPQGHHLKADPCRSLWCSCRCTRCVEQCRQSPY